MSDWSSLGEGRAKKSEADSQYARTSYADYRTEQSDASKAKHKEVLTGSVRLIVLGAAVLLVGVLLYNVSRFLDILSMLVIFVGMLLVVLGITTRYFGE